METAGTVERQERLERMIRDDYRLIWRLLRRLGVPRDAAEDATQQVFLIAAERLDDIKLRSERAFAFGTALRVAQSVRRRHSRESGAAELEGRAAGQPLPDELADQNRAREQVDRVLSRMPLELRSVFVLFELEGLTSPEIAQLSGLPLGTVASRLRRARARFRELLAHDRAAPPDRPEGRLSQGAGS